MRRFPVEIAIAIVTLASTGCLRPTEPLPRAELYVAADTVRANVINGVGVEWVRFRVPATVVNSGSTPVLLNPQCSSWLEWTDETRWRKAWGTICMLIPRPPEELGPGEVLEFEIEVFLTLQGEKASPWNSPYLTGQYRMGTSLFRADRGQATTPLLSAPFVLATSE